MSVREQVAKAQTPRDAIMMLAGAVDALAERLETQQSDPWTDWDSDEPPKDTLTEASTKARIAELREALNTGKYEDAEEQQALSAELRLLLDNGEGIETGPPEGERPILERTGDGVTVNLPPPNEAQAGMRTEFVKEVLAKDPAMQPFMESFVKGGPLLFYHSDRDYVMGLDPKWRQLFVQDVAMNSPAEAQEMGRDILKVEDDEMDPSLKIEQFQQ